MVRPALVVAGLAISASAPASPRAGKVVRVERTSGKPLGDPRLCKVNESDLTAYCYGKKPEAGELITVVTTHRVIATLRIEFVNTGQCAQAPFWAVQTKLESGDVANANDPQMLGTLDIPFTSSNGRLVKLDHLPGDRPSHDAAAIDTNGDGDAELVFVEQACDDAGKPSTSPTGECIDVWYAEGHRLEPLRTDRIPQSCF